MGRMSFVRKFCQKCLLSEMSFVRNVICQKPKFYKKWYFFQIRYYIDIKLELGLGERQVRWRPGGLGAERPRVRFSQIRWRPGGLGRSAPVLGLIKSNYLLGVWIRSNQNNFVSDHSLYTPCLV